MEAIQKRKKLHEYIDSANDEKVDALFLILEAGDGNSYQYSSDEMNTFYERKKKFLKGEGKNFSVENFFDQIRKSK